MATLSSGAAARGGICPGGECVKGARLGSLEPHSPAAPRRPPVSPAVPSRRIGDVTRGDLGERRTGAPGFPDQPENGASEPAVATDDALLEQSGARSSPSGDTDRKGARS